MYKTSLNNAVGILVHPLKTDNFNQNRPDEISLKHPNQNLTNI